MFQQLEDEYSFGSWVTQLVISCVAPEIALLCIFYVPLELLSMLPAPAWNVDNGSSGAKDYGFQLLIYVILAALSAGLARIVSNIWRRSIREGRFTWVIPVALVMVTVLLELLAGRGRKLYGLFFVTGPGEGSAFAVVLVVYPTFSATVYSTTMWWLYRQREN